MFYLGVRLSLPLMAGLVLADIAMGIIARAVPQINVFMLEFPAKILLGLLLFAGAASAMYPFLREFSAAKETLPGF